MAITRAICIAFLANTTACSSLLDYEGVDFSEHVDAGVVEEAGDDGSNGGSGGTGGTNAGTGGTNAGTGGTNAGTGGTDAGSGGGAGAGGTGQGGQAGAPPSLRLMTFNIASAHCASGCLYGNPGPQLQEVASIIHRARAEVVGIQEIERGTARHAGVDMLDVLTSNLAALGWNVESRWAARFPVDGGEFGQAVLSRFPILDYQAFPLQAGSDAVAQTFRVEVQTQSIRVFNYHPYPQLACQTTDPHLLNVVSQFSSESSILLGDFNMGRTAPCYTAVTATHEDSCLWGGDPSCMETVDPVIRPDVGPGAAVDYIFHRFAGLNAQLIEAHVDSTINQTLDVSDHFPVIATFSVGP